MLKKRSLQILRNMSSAVPLEEQFNIIKEGKATILTPKEDKVFYNPIQQFNRDLSITCINAWSQQFSEKQDESSKKRKVEPYLNILEALSATGLRAVRYGHEIPMAKKIIANDLLADAVKSIERNIEHNGLKDRVVGNQGDAIRYMSLHPDKFHVVDLDPYGTAAPFIDSALQAIKDEGILLVTCTDAGVLAGSGYPEKCFALYGGNNFGNTWTGSETNHEAGLRLILNMIASTASKYKKSIEPLLSLSIDFYFRLIIRVKTSPLEVKKLASKTSIVYHCTGCGQKLLQPLGRLNETKYQTPRLVTQFTSDRCDFCHSNWHIAGPMWLGPLHNREFIDTVLQVNDNNDDEIYKTKKRIKGMLNLARDELELPFYFNLNQISSTFKSPPISIKDFVRAVGNLGYEASLTHAKKNSIKTNAPWSLILQINREWLKVCNQNTLEKLRLRENQDENSKNRIEQLENDISISTNLSNNTPGFKILESLKTITEQPVINFKDDNPTSDKILGLRNAKIVKFQENPTKNWGPKARPSNK